MSEKKQDFQNGSTQSDLWYEYLDELDKSKIENEKVNKEEKPQANKPQISKQVEADLLEFAKTSRRTIRNTRSGSKAAPIIIALIVLFISMFTILSFRSYNSYSEEIYYDDPVEVEPIEIEDYVENYGVLTSPSFYTYEGEGEAYYTLPIKVQDLLEANDWVISNDAFSEVIEEVGETPQRAVIKTNYGSKVADVMVVSEGGTVPIEEATIVGMSIDQDSYVYLGYGVGPYSSTDTVEYYLQEAGTEYTKTGQGRTSQYIVNQKLDGEYNNYNLQINMADDEVNNITMIVDKN